MAETYGSSELVPPMPPRLYAFGSQLLADRQPWTWISAPEETVALLAVGPSGPRQLLVSMPLPVTRFLCHSKGTEVFVGVRFTRAMLVSCSTSFSDVCVSEHWETRCEPVLCFVIKQFEDCLALPVSVPPAGWEALPSHAVLSPSVPW